MKKTFIMKKTIIILLMVAVVSAVNAKKKWEITTSGETLTALTQVTDNKEPCFNPFGGDYGKDLYFTVQENKKYFNIYKKENPFSSAMSPKTSGKNFNSAPCYSPTTDKIAFRCWMDGAYTSDIYMMNNTRGQALAQVTESANAFEDWPSFNEDGTLLVYNRVQYSAYKKMTFLSFLFGFGGSTVFVQSSDIWIKNLQTGESTLLGNGYQPSFSPDGKRIAFVKYSNDAKSTCIWIMDIDGSNQQQITDAKKGYAFGPRWSPDGKRLIFQSAKKDKKDFDIYVIDTDGNNLIQLTTNKSADCQPYWTKDGYIYFASDRGNDAGQYQIWRFKFE